MGCILAASSSNQRQTERERSSQCMATCGTTRVVPDKKIKITGCTFMENGHLVTVDFNNRRIKLYDQDLKCRSFINLIQRPFDVCAVQSNLYITFPKRKYVQRFKVTCQMMCLKRKLMQRNIFPTEGECRGIVSYDKDLIISVKFTNHASTDITDSQWQVQIISVTGSVKRRIMHSSQGLALFHDARYIALTPGQYELVIAEGEDNRVKCLDIKTGELTFNHHMEDPKGVTCDKSGNIYVLGKHGAIRWILADREYIKVLLKGTSGVNFSDAITYLKRINTLAVPRNENRIELYKIKNSIHDG
ncbi:hypothetical protein ACF0H5_003922 [Mactra antiquata]